MCTLRPINPNFHVFTANQFKRWLRRFLWICIYTRNQLHVGLSGLELKPLVRLKLWTKIFVNPI